MTPELQAFIDLNRGRTSESYKSDIIEHTILCPQCSKHMGVFACAVACEECLGPERAKRYLDVIDWGMYNEVVKLTMDSRELDRMMTL